MVAPVVFTPPQHSPQIIERRLSGYAGQPLHLASHGWDYVLTGNSLLNPARLRTILESATDPRQAVGKVLAVYREKGYFLVAVTATMHPAQDAAGKTEPEVEAPAREGSKGWAHIYVIEGRITTQEMPASLKGYYAGIANDPSLTVDQITRRGVLANDYAVRDGMALHPSIKPAPQPGGTEFSIDSTPSPSYKQVSGALQVGNYGSRYLSTYVTGVNLTMYPGDGTQLTANYLGGQPSWGRDSAGSSYRSSGFGFTKVTPWGIYGGDLQTTYYRLGKVSAPLFNTGNITLINLTGKQLLFADTRSQFWLTEGFHRVSNRIDVYGGYYTLLNQQYDYLSVGFEYKHGFRMFGQSAGLSLDYTYNEGDSPRSGTFSIYTVNTAPTPRFGYHQVNFTLQQGLSKGFLAQLNLRGQWSYDTLPQQQQWVLGGFGSLSSYRGGFISGDSGYSARLMIQAPTHHLGPVAWTPNVFLEQGDARYRYLHASWSRALDYGLGVNVSSRFGTNLAMVYALPLNHPGVTDKTADAQRAGIYFVLQQSF